MKHLSFAKKIATSVSGILVSASLFATPALAAGDTSITLGNSVCDFNAAGLGKGTASSPFLINTSKQLAEVDDCLSVSVTITGITGNGSLITYTANNEFGAGQEITISNNDPSVYNFDGNRVKVVSATSTTFTVKGTATDSFVSGGTAVAGYHFFKLNADLTLSGASDAWNDTSASGWTPLAQESSFYGTFDGNGHTITGLTISANQDRIGLFAYSDGATFKNITMTDVDIDQSGASTHSYAAALVADSSSTNFDNISISGDLVAAGDYSGLISAQSDYTNARDITVSGTISAHSPTNSFDPRYMGGAFGNIYYGNITNAESSVAINAANTVDDTAVSPRYGTSVGGLFGQFREGALNTANATGDITGARQNVGTVGGYTYDFDAHNVTSSSDITMITSATYDRGDYASYIGGVFGYTCCGTVYDSSATGNVIVDDTATPTNHAFTNINRVGAFMGEWGCCGDIVRSHSTGNVTINTTRALIENIGGFTGSADCCGNIDESYSTGNVSVTNSSNQRTSQISAFVGEWGCCGSFENSYSSGSLTVDTSAGSGQAYDIGGFLGRSDCCGGTFGSHTSSDVTVLGNSTNHAQYIGGFIGSTDVDMDFVNSYATGDVNVTNGSEVGGFTGYSDFATAYSGSYATGDVTVTYDGVAMVGGFIGTVDGTNSIETSYATGNVTVSEVTDGQVASQVGGFIGNHSSGDALQIHNSFASGNVSGGADVAGFVGRTFEPNLNITNSYSAGTVTATETGGAIDAFVNGPYQDASGTDVFDSTKAGSVTTTTLAAGKTTSEMKTQSTFTDLGWEFGEGKPWQIDASVNSGYPYPVTPAADTPDNGGSGETTTVTKTSIKALGTVKFKLNSTKLTAASKKSLRALAKKIKTKKYKRVLVMGFASVGGKSASHELNQFRLSKLRAQATSKYLKAQLKKLNVKGVKFVVVGAGAQNPVASNKTKKGQAKNRRAEISAIG